MLGEINIILSDDENLLEINKKFLDSSYYTDIITFNYNLGEIISGDLYLSMERISENSRMYNNSFERETLLVIAHGILHLIGFDDKGRLRLLQKT